MVSNVGTAISTFISAGLAGLSARGCGELVEASGIRTESELDLCPYSEHILLEEVDCAAISAQVEGCVA